MAEKKDKTGSGRGFFLSEAFERLEVGLKFSSTSQHILPRKQSRHDHHTHQHKQQHTPIKPWAAAKESQQQKQRMNQP